MKKQVIAGPTDAGYSSIAVRPEDDTGDLLRVAARRAGDYLSFSRERAVFPGPEAIAGLEVFDEPLPQAPRDPLAVLMLLDEVGSPATVTSSSGRYFGFVIGGALPV